MYLGPRREMDFLLGPLLGLERPLNGLPAQGKPLCLMPYLARWSPGHTQVRLLYNTELIHRTSPGRAIRKTLLERCAPVSKKHKHAPTAHKNSPNMKPNSQHLKTLTGLYCRFTLSSVQVGHLPAPPSR